MYTVNTLKTSITSQDLKHPSFNEENRANIKYNISVNIMDTEIEWIVSNVVLEETSVFALGKRIIPTLLSGNLNKKVSTLTLFDMGGGLKDPPPEML